MQQAVYFMPVLIALCIAAGNAAATPATGAVTQAAPPAPRATAAWPDAPAETLVNRYTAMSLQPSAADLDPTKVVVQVSFPRMNTKTVGDAIRYLLVRTGYELASDGQLHAQVVALLGKRLPDSQRTLGPYQVDTMLGILIGPAFVVVTDHVNRSISFQPLRSSIPSASTELQTSISAPAASNPAAN